MMTHASSTSDLDQHSDLRVFIPPRRLIVLMVACTLFSLSITVVCIWAAIANSDKSFTDPVTAAVMSGCIGGASTLLGAYGVLSYRRMRLLALPTVVRVISAFRDRSIALADVTRARWRCRPAGGSVVLHAPGCRVVIEFASYDGWRELVAYFRQSLPQAVQENYEVFEGRFIVRLVRRLPIVFSEGMTLKLSVASLIVAAAYWAMWDFQWTRMVSGYPLTFCPAIAVMAALDCVRRRRRLGFLAMLVALAAVAFLFAALWPTIRPLVKGG